MHGDRVVSCSHPEKISFWNSQIEVLIITEADGSLRLTVERSFLFLGTHDSPRANQNNRHLRRIAERR